MLRNGIYARKKKVSGKRVYVPLDPQPTNVLALTRYYTTLVRDPSYRRRISWLGDERNPVAVVEYIGSYPAMSLPHGNAKKHLDDEYRRTHPVTMKQMKDMAKDNPPRKMYRTLTMNDWFDAPKDIKQCQNIVYRGKKNVTKEPLGSKNNFADELLECMQMVDTHPFVQQVIKSQSSLPYFILYTEH